MGARPSKSDQHVDVEQLKEEIAVDVITRLSAEINHQLFQHEARLNKHDEQIMDLTNEVRLLRTSILLQTQEIKVLHEIKKNITPSKLSQLRSLIRIPQKVAPAPQNNSERVS